MPIGRPMALSSSMFNVRVVCSMPNSSNGRAATSTMVFVRSTPPPLSTSMPAMWSPSASTPSPIGCSPGRSALHLSTAKEPKPASSATPSLVASPSASGCTTAAGNPSHRRVGCIARALWQLIETTTNTFPLDTISAYCVGPGNGCRNEVGLNASNWADFRTNWVGTAATINTVSTARNLNGSL
jgi:hypothetical protein